MPIKGEGRRDGDKPDGAGAGADGNGGPGGNVNTRGGTPNNGAKKELTKAEEQRERERRKSESMPPGSQTPATVTTKSGRASKPSTPAMATFQEAATRAARPSRGGGDGSNSGGSNKKGHGHRKSASTASQALAAAQAAPPATASAPPAGAGGMHDDDGATSGEGDVDADEPTYCYCNGVSYGEMVACDSDDCEREWFHLACVGLKVAPAENREYLNTMCLGICDVLTNRSDRDVVLRGLQGEAQDWGQEGQRSMRVSCQHTASSVSHHCYAMTVCYRPVYTDTDTYAHTHTYVYILPALN